MIHQQGKWPLKINVEEQSRIKYQISISAEDYYELMLPTGPSQVEHEDALIRENPQIVAISTASAVGINVELLLLLIHHWPTGSVNSIIMRFKLSLRCSCCTHKRADWHFAFLNILQIFEDG